MRGVFVVYTSFNIEKSEHFIKKSRPVYAQGFIIDV